MSKPFNKADLLSAVAHIQPLNSDVPNKAAYSTYAKAVTAYTAVESAFVPVGQTDTQLRNELRSLLAVGPVRPVADIFRKGIECYAEGVLGSDPTSLAWAYVGAMEPVDDVACGLGTLHARWLRTVAYSALIAYGRPGAALPPSPAGLAIDVGLVPADKSRTRFVDEDDDEGAGIPVTVFARR